MAPMQQTKEAMSDERLYQQSSNAAICRAQSRSVSASFTQPVKTFKTARTALSTTLSS